MNNKSLLYLAYEILKNTSETPRLDAEVLLAFITNKSRVYCIYHNDEQPEELSNNYIKLIEQRATGMPLAYLTGVQEFWSLPILVSEDTLIPRADTELLIEIILLLYKGKKSLKILELCKGRGAIACALAHEKPLWDITATDISNKALDIAKKNAKNLECKISFCLSDWFNNIPSAHYDLIVSNPPYLARDDLHLQGDIKYEPNLALIGGIKGTEPYEEIFSNAKNYLKNGGNLIVEHGYYQKDELSSMLKHHNYYNIKSWQDIAGNDRVLFGSTA